MKVLKFLFAASLLLIFSASTVFATVDDKLEKAIETNKEKIIENFEDKGVSFTKSQLSEIDELYEKALESLSDKSEANEGENISQSIVNRQCNEVRMKIMSEVLTDSQQKSLRSVKDK